MVSFIFFSHHVIHPLHYLPGGGDPSDDGEADDDPGHEQREGHFDVEAAALCDGAGGVQSLTVPEISRSRAFVTLWLHNCMFCRQKRWRRSFSVGDNDGK